MESLARRVRRLEKKLLSKNEMGVRTNGTFGSPVHASDSDNLVKDLERTLESLQIKIEDRATSGIDKLLTSVATIIHSQALLFTEGVLPRNGKSLAENLSRLNNRDETIIDSFRNNRLEVIIQYRGFTREDREYIKYLNSCKGISDQEGVVVSLDSEKSVDGIILNIKLNLK